MKKAVAFISILLIFLNWCQLKAQETTAVNWIGFEQLYDSLEVKPKKVFIDFYADWCQPCKRMDREVFTDPEIQDMLNRKYYAVKMDVESTDTIQFGDQVFVNERLNRRNPVHQIAILMASRKNRPFSLPAMVILDENFQAKARYFQFLNKEQLLKALREN
ncbi:thioredoxin family protein [Gramella sp. GC03-9]|uniref:Thioredoxin family protein n=1 Tax=Christiangramia oceanisediminis TaxID=2920386 RepID=A0A9X2I7V8_9FLAO|nr:thioredoxin family protein [Gramella oceanisediminis]MCP9199389.1 thioredoxin family protein [Gramella oceanisediminis]